MSYKTRNSGRSLLPFGLDYSDVTGTGSTSETPQFVLPVDGPLTETEILAARLSVQISKLMLDGPFYTGDSARLDKGKERNTEPDGIERHSDKYRKVKKVGKTIHEYPYCLQLFPEELYPVIGVSKRTAQKLSTVASNVVKDDLASINVTDSSAQKIDIVEKLKDFAEDLDSNDTKKDEDHEEDEEDLDVEFEEDEDDDYNAEKYFDDGDDDMGDEGDDEAAF